jgi:ABC-type multidrug transport system ATPase subunit
LGQGRRTVLLSSHLMGELEQICDRVGVVKQGSLITEGSLDDLRHGTRLKIKAEPADQAREQLESLVGIGQVEITNTNVLMVDADPERAAEINKLLVSAGINVSELCAVKDSLESVFLSLTEEAGPNG